MWNEESTERHGMIKVNIHVQNLCGLKKRVQVEHVLETFHAYINFCLNRTKKIVAFYLALYCSHFVGWIGHKISKIEIVIKKSE